MQAGIELDSIIAERVFGDKFEYQQRFKGYYRPWKQDPIAFEPCPKYSTDIKEAWKVVEQLLRILPNEDVHMEHWNDGESSGWQVSTCFELGEWKGWVEAETLPHAICLAALKVFKVSDYGKRGVFQNRF